MGGGSGLFPPLLAELFGVVPGGMRAGPPSGWGELLLQPQRWGEDPWELVALPLTAEVIKAAELSSEPRFES